VYVAVGDQERRMCLTVSKGCDRYTDTVVLVQSGKSTIIYLSPAGILTLKVIVDLTPSPP